MRGPRNGVEQKWRNGKRVGGIKGVSVNVIGNTGDGGDDGCGTFPSSVEAGRASPVNGVFCLLVTGKVARPVKVARLT